MVERRYGIATLEPHSRRVKSDPPLRDTAKPGRHAGSASLLSDTPHHLDPCHQIAGLFRALTGPRELAMSRLFSVGQTR